MQQKPTKPNPHTQAPPLPTIDQNYLPSSHYSYYSSHHLQNPISQTSVQPLHHHEIYTDPATTTTTTFLSSYAHGYYLDPNWSAKEAVRRYGSDPSGFVAPVVNVTRQVHALILLLLFQSISAYACLFARMLKLSARFEAFKHLDRGVKLLPNVTEQLTIAYPGSNVWANLTLRPHQNATWKKHQKTTKIVQSAYCEFCKVDCNGKDMLDQHKLGKKHKKNLEKLQAVATPDPGASARSSNPIIGPQENPDKNKTDNKQRSKKKAAQPAADLETKKRKIVEGGAAAHSVRTCAICNVVCNSDTVYNHLSGQKHAAMLKKHATGIQVAAVIQI